MRTVAALLTLVVVALGQDCPSSPCDTAAKKEASGLSAKIAKLEKSAANGCEKSEAKLTALCKAAGATDTKDLKAKVAAYEKYAPCGCDMSQKKLDELTAVLAAQPRQAVVSGRLPLVLALADNGDPRAKTVLKQLCDECCPQDCGKGQCGKGQCGKGAAKGECGQECGDELVARIQALETSAANGCTTSAAKLGKAQAALAALPTTSARVAKVLAVAQQGDTKAHALLMSLCEDCCPSDCGKGQCGKGAKGECDKACGDKLIARIQAMETSAAKGCATSVTKLVRVEAKLAGTATAKKPAGCGECRGCPGEQ